MSRETAARGAVRPVRAARLPPARPATPAPTCPPAPQQRPGLLRRPPPAQPLLQRRVAVPLRNAELSHRRPPEEQPPVHVGLGALPHQLQPRQRRRRHLGLGLHRARGPRLVHRRARGPRHARAHAARLSFGRRHHRRPPPQSACASCPARQSAVIFVDLRQPSPETAELPKLRPLPPVRLVRGLAAVCPLLTSPRSSCCCFC